MPYSDYTCFRFEFDSGVAFVSIDHPPINLLDLPLIQELHREANTLGSKSAALELTRISVDMKVLIEQMREQVQNIE